MADNMVTANYPGGTQTFDPNSPARENLVWNSITGQLETASGTSVSGGGNSLATVVAQKTPVASAIGDSIVRNMYTPFAWGGPAGTGRQWTGFGAWILWASFYSGGKFITDEYSIEGYSGNRTFQIYAAAQGATATEAWGSDAAATIGIGLRARTCDIVVDMSGTNDMLYALSAEITDGTALQRAIAGRQAIWAYIRSIGRKPAALSLLPREGSLIGGAGAMTQDQLKPLVPAWNAAMKAAAEADGVAWIDGYTPCAAAGGGWKPGYVYHSGSNDPTMLHPSLLASIEIGKAAAPVLSSMILSAPSAPRMLLGSSEIYTAAFVANDPRVYYDNFANPLFAGLSGWSTNFDPQADGTRLLAATTQDVSGGGTMIVRKPARTTSAYHGSISGDKTVAGGQSYLLAFDARLVLCDGFTSVAVKVIDRTTGSSSLNQPIASFLVSAQEVPPLTPLDTGVGRLALPYKIPANVNKVALLLELNRSAGGAASGNDELYVSNMVNIRTA